MLEQSPRPRRRFIETPTSRLIRGLLERSRERPEPCLIVGVPGIGKTATIEDIAASDPFARIVTPTPATARNKPFLQDVAGAFHYSTWRKSTPELQSLLWEGLPARAEEGQYLIIDEAQTLDLDASRSALHPWERARLPEAFVGNPAVLKRTRVADPAFKQFADRLHNQLVIPGPTEKDVDSFGIHYNVDF